MPPGGAVGFQGHYTPFGKEVTDRTKVALYFYKDDETPDLVMHNIDITNNAVEIPPNTARHVEVAYMDFPHDALLYSAFIHAHYRATASDLSIRYKDGTEKMLIALPRYQFGWQRHYTFAEPIKIPAGSRLIAHYVYDNSRQNPSNPDPSKTIVWGPQSWEEMFFTRLRYRWMDETSTRRVAYAVMVARRSPSSLPAPAWETSTVIATATPHAHATRIWHPINGAFTPIRNSPPDSSKSRSMNPRPRC